MSDQPSKTGIVPNQVDDSALVSTYVPDQVGRMLKARFWAAVSDNPTLDVRTLTDDAICRLTNSVMLKEMLGNPTFRAWFFDEQYFKYKTLANAEKALDTLSHILDLPDYNKITLLAKMKAAEMLLKLGGYLGEASKNKTKFADHDVQQMSEAELKKFLDAAMKRTQEPGDGT